MKGKFKLLSENIGIILIIVTVTAASVLAFFSTSSLDEISEEELAGLPTVNPLPIFLVVVGILIVVIILLWLSRCKNGKSIQ